jgi:hypothetical protein
MTTRVRVATDAMYGHRHSPAGRPQCPHIARGTKLAGASGALGARWAEGAVTERVLSHGARACKPGLRPVLELAHGQDRVSARQ